MDEALIDARVSLICELGCVRVRELIAAWDAGVTPVEVEDLDQAARNAVLAELKSIMAVYDARG